MADTTDKPADPTPAGAPSPTQAAPQGPERVRLESGTYEVLRNRMGAHAQELRKRMELLNAERKRVFGSIDLKLLSSQQIVTENNCLARDMIPVGDRAIFGYNVFIGLRSKTSLSDVFSVYRWVDGALVSDRLDLILDAAFVRDFDNLYQYFRNTFFAKFAIIGPHLFMVFQVGKDPEDIKTFKWLIQGNSVTYCDNRSDHEFVLPPQHGFEWTRATRDMQRSGRFPHISIEDRIFVETIGGDLTIKIEDNTESGEGIFREGVENPDQTLDDAEIYYSIVGHIILLKIRPYKEPAFRYVVYSEKTQQATRLDAIKDCCVLLPDDHGLIFSRGVFLQTGQVKQFESGLDDMVFEKCIPAPNGEDFLYLFYNRQKGIYLLLSYNLIDQQLDTPLICDGFSLFEDGKLLCFRSDGTAQKHHTVQVWQTPFTHPDHSLAVQTDTELYKIGNKAVVRCLAECTELLELVGKEDTYSNLYMDIVRLAQNIRDGYFWLNSTACSDLAAPIEEIRRAGAAAVEEFDKVVRTRRNTRQQIEAASAEVLKIIGSINYYELRDIDTFVRLLSSLRTVRGQIVSLKDLRYADAEQIAAMEKLVGEHTEKLSAGCVDFLLKEEALAPYHQRVAELGKGIEGLKTVAQAREHGLLLEQAAGDLELLTQIVSNLKIADTTASTAIVDRISLVYSQLNQVRAALKNCISQRAEIENRSEFSAQVKLIDQAVVNYLDVCAQPEKCDEYLTKVLVQIEALETRFADLEEFIEKLAGKREELYSAFESRKVQLVEARNRRASAHLAAAERILKGVRSRAESMETIREINGYFAGDLMVERVREIIQHLRDMGDSVKAEDVASQLKTIQQDAARQLKDRQGLYEDGQNVIRLGQHRFSVNRQALELTLVPRDGKMWLHLAGTGFFEELADEGLLAERELWDVESCSETPGVYRAEYLAYLIFRSLDAAGIDLAARQGLDELTRQAQEFMAPRYAENYIKGVHDHDAAVLLQAITSLHQRVGLLRYASPARALATVCWHLEGSQEACQKLYTRIHAVSPVRELFPGSNHKGIYLGELRSTLAKFIDASGLFSHDLLDQAAEYFYYELSTPGSFVISRKAHQLARDFVRYLEANRIGDRFFESTRKLSDDGVGWYRVILDWVRAYLSQAQAGDAAYCQEVAAALLTGLDSGRPVIEADVTADLSGLLGSHGRLDQGRYRLDYCEFMTRLAHHDSQVVPRIRRLQEVKKQVVQTAASRLRLEEYQAKVLTTFVRNQLIDRVYLPLIGDNMAKQLGALGDQKRTDRQGLLLLISPPGYGKTTLMEYVANRLGLIFVKVNGPAVGSRVTSLDPAEAPNAAAREELSRLNLAFEMGDNVMIYVDDIQHTNPEFLQKFISLCDAQRRIEGVYQGRTRTYDLRGKRVCVVMAGNPYTESGQRFRIPDMLSNRSDTYNIGDIVGDNQSAFLDSYIENCLTANPILSKLASRSQKDVYELMKLALGSSRDAVQFEGSYSVEELNEHVAVMKKLLLVRDVVLKVNTQYILSAGQEAQYRTEPPFLLQGSYRNMNRIAGRVLPVMNDAELWTLIDSTYEQDAQTLTASAEANLLKFRELTGRLSARQVQRWDEIKKTFGRNKLLGPADGDDKIGAVIRQLHAFGASMESIHDVLAGGIESLAKRREAPSKPVQAIGPQLGERLESFGKGLDQIRQVLADGIVALSSRQAPQSGGEVDGLKAASREAIEKLEHILQAVKDRSAADRQAHAGQADSNLRALTGVLEEQFHMMELWLEPVARSDSGRKEYAQHLQQRFQEMVEGYTRLIEVLQGGRPGQSPQAPAAQA